MLLTVYTLTMILPAVRILIGTIIAILLAVLLYRIVIWTITGWKGTIPRIKIFTPCIVVLIVIFSLIPDKHDIKSMIILSQLDKYIEDRNVSMADPGAISSAALSIENIIIRIENNVSDDLEGGK